MSQEDWGTERFLLIGAQILAVGVILVAVWVFLTYGGPTFEMLEDHASAWLGEKLGH